MSGEYKSNSGKNFERAASALLLLSIALFNCWTFIPSLRDEGLHHSDLGFHLSILKSLDTAVKSGQNPLDFWFDNSPFGFALFRSYQNLPYLILYSAYRILGESCSLDFCLRLSVLSLAILFPFSVFWSARKIGFPLLDAAAAAVLSSLVSEAQNFGLGLQNYTFGTGGMITQLWAVVALGPALSFALQYIRSGTGFASALGWVFLCFGSHVISAFILFFAVAAFVLVSVFHRSTSSLVRFFRYMAGVTLVTSYQWLFIALDGRYINQSIVEPLYKYGSHGLRWVVEKAAVGALFDANRFPSISILLLFGFFAAVGDSFVFSREKRNDSVIVLRWLVCVFFLSLSLLVGWDIWGPVFRNTPVLRSLHMHRFIIAVNFFGVLIAAYGFRCLRSLLPARPAIQAIALLGAFCLLTPAVEERIETHITSHNWRATSSAAWDTDGNLQDVIAMLLSKPRTYVHPGMHQTWANELRLGKMVPLHDIFIAQGIPTMGGILFHAFSLAGDTMFNFSAFRKATYDLFGVGTVIAPAPMTMPPFLKDEGTFGNYRVLSSGASRLGVIDVAFNLSGKRTDEASFMQRWVSSQLVERNIFGGIETTIPDIPQISFGDAVPDYPATLPPHRWTMTEGAWRQDGIEGEVHLERPAYVLLKTGYHPNWQATVDGTYTKPIWVTPGFLAIPVPSGRHTVTFTYYGSWLKVVLFSLTLIGLLGLIFRNQREQRQSSEISDLPDC